jgi:uncharacterized protein
MAPCLDRITLFPIKSCDGIDVQSAAILPSGALQHDREFAIIDADQKIVNAKRTGAIQRLRSTFNLADRTISIGLQPGLPDPELQPGLQLGRQPTTFHLDGDRQPLEQWLSDYFGFPVTLIQNTETGFPDDLASPGPTIVATASLEAVSQWYPGTDVAEMRRRFRTNLELGGVAAFWEDQLFDQAEIPRLFTIGPVQFEGINPCQRCIVPTRNSLTADTTVQFQKTFLAARAASLPIVVNRDRFNHFYKLAVNTRIPPSEAGKRLNLAEFCTLN